MKTMLRNFRRYFGSALPAVLILLTPPGSGWHNQLHAIDASSVASCALPRSLTLTARVGDPMTAYAISIGNNLIAGCSVDVAEPFTASVSFFNGGISWLSLQPGSGTLQQGQSNTIRAVFNPSSLPGVGTYQATILIRLSSVARTISIPVSAALSAPSPRISLSPASLVFQTVERTGIPPAQIVNLSNSGTGILDWTLDESAIPAWLSLTPHSGSLNASLMTPTRLTVRPVSAELDNGVYSALIPFRATGQRSSPQYLSVTYHVVRPTADPIPQLSPYGMSFTAQAGSSDNQQQTFVFSNIGGGTVNAQFTASSPGGNWLTVTPASAAATSGVPVNIVATINSTGLPVGTYRGKITGTFSVLQPQSVDVVLTITPGAPKDPDPPRCNWSYDYCQGAAPVAPVRTIGAVPLAGCTATTMTLAGSTVGNGSNSPVSFPQALTVQVLDNCGEPVLNATVVAAVGGVSIPITNAGGGYYTGTWTPQQADTGVNVTFAAFHPFYNSVQQSFNVASITASGGTVLPTLFNEGVVDGAAFTQRAPLMPGGIVSLFGSSLASSTVSASQIPLERELAQTSVLIGGVPAPLYFVSSNQINAQVPYESRPGDTVSIIVNVAGRLTSPQNYQIAPVQPGIFVDSLGPAVLDDQFRRITPANPARIGRVIQIFAAGLGDTVPAVSSGDALQTGSTVTLPISISLGGSNAVVQYNGLAPGFVGLYQINATVPIGVSTGPAIPLLMRQNGVPSNPEQTLTIPVAP